MALSGPCSIKVDIICSNWEMTAHNDSLRHFRPGETVLLSYLSPGEGKATIIGVRVITMKLGETRGCSCGCVCGGDGARVLGSLATSPTFLGDRNQPLYLLVGVGLLVKMTATAPDAERLFRFKYRLEGRGFSLAGPVCHRHHHGHLWSMAFVWPT